MEVSVFDQFASDFNGIPSRKLSITFQTGMRPVRIWKWRLDESPLFNYKISGTITARKQVIYRHISLFLPPLRTLANCGPEKSPWWRGVQQVNNWVKPIENAESLPYCSSSTLDQPEWTHPEVRCQCCARPLNSQLDTVRGSDSSGRDPPWPSCGLEESGIESRVIRLCQESERRRRARRGRPVVDAGVVRDTGTRFWYFGRQAGLCTGKRHLNYKRCQMCEKVTQKFRMNERAKGLLERS